MGAYENPQPIIDRSGEIMGQAAYRAGANVASIIRQYYQGRNIAAEQRRKETKRVQAIQAAIEEKQYANLNSNYSKLQKTSKSLADQFKLKTAELLDGTEDQMGAIEAQTLLSTADLTKEDRKKYREIVQNAQVFQQNVLSGGADILVDLEDMADVAPQDLNTKFFFVGNDEFDELTSQFTASVLANKEVPGAQTTKELRNEDGAAIVSVSTVFDVNSEEAKALLRDIPDLNDRVENGKLQFTWERNINELGDGFLKKIPEGLNADTSYKNAGIEDQNGKFGQNYMLGTPVSRREPSGAEGRDNIVTTQYINTPAIFSNESLLTDARVKSKAMIGANANKSGEIRAYLRKEYNFTNDDIKDFLSQEPDKQIKDLQELEVQRITDLKLKGKGFGSRIATEEDANYMNNNAKAAVEGQSIRPVIAGETMIYFSQKSIPASSITKSSGSSSSTDKNIMSKETWESYKESGYQPSASSSFVFEWNDKKGAFEQFKMGMDQGATTKQPTGRIARSPQELGNLTGETIKNYEGFERAFGVRPLSEQEQQRENSLLFQGVKTGEN